MKRIDLASHSYSPSSRSLFTRIALVAGVAALWATLSVHSSIAETKSSRDFTSKSYETKGSWHIETKDSKRFLVLSNDFRTQAAPDLKIFVSPKSVKQLGDSNATDGSLRVAVLKKHDGGQRYELPKNLDLSKYKTLAIHCVQYSKLFAASSLR